MRTKKLRAIEVNNESYLWKRKHFHLTEFELSQCVEIVTIFLKGFKDSPLRLYFREEDNLITEMDVEKEKWCVGHPEVGIIWLYKYKTAFANNEPYPLAQLQTIKINLNRPAVIAELIKYFNLQGWNPKETRKPFIEENALRFIKKINLIKDAY